MDERKLVSTERRRTVGRVERVERKIGVKKIERRRKARQVLFKILVNIGIHLKMNIAEITTLLSLFWVFIKVTHLSPFIKYFLKQPGRMYEKIMTKIKGSSGTIATDMVNYFNDNPVRLALCAGSFLITDEVDFLGELQTFGQDRLQDALGTFEKDINNVAKKLMEDIALPEILKISANIPITPEILELGYIPGDDSSLDTYFSKELELYQNKVSKKFIDPETELKNSELVKFAEIGGCKLLSQVKKIVDFDLPEQCVQKPFNTSVFETNCPRVHQDLTRIINREVRDLSSSCTNIIRNSLQDVKVEGERVAADVLGFSTLFVMFVIVYVIYSAIRSMVCCCFARKKRRDILIEEVDEKENMKFPVPKKKLKKRSKSAGKLRRKSRGNSRRKSRRNSRRKSRRKSRGKSTRGKSMKRSR